jgi:HK97 family phage portal protein
MNWFNRIFQKQSQAANIVSLTSPKEAISSPRNFQGFTKEGYKKNVVVFRCINLIADSVSSIPHILYKVNGKKKTEIESHFLLDLINQPNPSQDKESFFKSLISYYSLTGNSYIEKIMIGSKPKELYSLRPDRMEIMPGKNGMPSAYIFKIGSESYSYPVDFVTGESDIKHLKTFNPNDDWLGMSPIEAMASDVDIVNAMNLWNLSLLQNSGRPSGALIYKPDQGPSSLNPNQRETLKKEIEEKISGARNSGRPLLLDGGFTWQEMSLSPDEMDFLNSKDVSEKDIALGFGVPGQLVGIKDSQTFANFEQARAIFYEDTAVPIAKMLYRGLNNWLVKRVDPSLSLEPDLNAIEALSVRKMEKWDKISNANFLTVDEKRMEIGYGNYQPNENAGSKILVNQGLITLEMATDDSFDEASPTEEEEPEIEEEDDKSLKKKIVILDGKQFNLNSQRAKRRFVQETARKRLRFEKILVAAFKKAFIRQKKTMIEMILAGGVSTWEMQIVKSLEITKGYFMEVYQEEVRDILRSFAKDIFGIKKSFKQEEHEIWFDSFMREYIEKQTGRKIKSIERTTFKRVTARVKDVVEEMTTGIEAFGVQPIAKAIEEIYEEFTPSRALTIARTEVHNAANQSSLKAVEALDLPNMTKEWLTVMDGRERDDHHNMNGEIVPFDENFEVESEKDGTIVLMSGPGDPTAPAEQVINCRCSMVFSQEIADET